MAEREANLSGMKLRTWLRPGMLIKRWVLMLFAGFVLTSLALAMGLAWIYRNYNFPESTAGFVQTITLQFIPHPWRELVVIAFGLGAMGYGFWQLSRSLLSPFMDQSPGSPALAEIIATHRFGAAEPELRIVTIGGGTGLSTLLRGLKQHNVAITAIVTVGDDGGSSGRLRSEFNVPSPGDIRNCLVALADNETTLGDLFQYRFEAEDSALHGHSFGAELDDGRIIRGESNIPLARGRISQVFIEPRNAEAYDPAIVALLSADLIVLGPGSLYTSVLPNLLVEGIAHALRFAPGEKIYVCNVATQPGETDDYKVIDHLHALYQHVPNILIDRVLINSNLAPAETRIKPEWKVSAVEFDGLHDMAGRVVIDKRDIVNPEFPLRHDPEKLAAALISIGRERLSSLGNRANENGRVHAVLERDLAGQRQRATVPSGRVPIEAGTGQRDKVAS